MNAHALLTSQGWRGTGHSLHPTSDNTGLTHHILIKRNQDGSGLGSKKDHKQEAWWLNAFDQALKGIDMKSGTMKQTLKGGALEKITARHAATKYTGARGLYTSFVRGGVMEGAAHDPAAFLPTPPASGVGTPLPATETEGGEREETKEERRARRQAKKVRKEEAQREAEKRAAKKAKKNKTKEAERQATIEAKAKRRLAEKVEKKKAKKAERQTMKEARKATETKEERRTRREARRRRKEDKRLARAAR